MALIHSFEKSGNLLFRFRGQWPLVLFILAVPVIYFTDESNMSDPLRVAVNIFAVILSFTGLVIRSVAIATTPKGTSGRNTRSGQVAESLNTTGIYSVVRHPLYLGNYFMWIGIVVFTYNIWFVLLVSLAFWLYYERIMFAEERFLEREFGKTYLEWSGKVPAFFPDFSRYQRNEMGFSFKSILRREYSGFLATVAAFVFVDHLRHYFSTGQFEPQRISTYILGAALVITLVLRTLKHNTRLLDEEGRS